MKKIFNFSQIGFISKAILLISFALIFKQLSFGQSCSNLVINGDFSAGNTGFTSGLTYVAPGPVLASEQYSVLNSTQVPSANPQWSCTDHTTGTGTFFVCDGSTIGAAAWSQTIPATGNATQGCYKFSFWVNNSIIVTRDYTDPVIQARINGVNVGAAVALPELPDIWVQVTGTWTGTLPATLQIFSTSTASTGNDFAIDDISFSKCCDVSINAQTALTKCALNYSIASTVCGIAPFSYQWCSGSTTASYNTGLLCGSNTLCVTMTDATGCVATATQTVIANESSPPSITCPANKTISCDASILPTNTGEPITKDNCGLKSTTYTDGTTVAVSQPCGTQFVRTWTAEDNCGNKSTCTQTITLIDTTPPTFSNCPPDQTVSTTQGKCVYDLTMAWKLGIKDNCDPTPTLSLVYNGNPASTLPATLPKGVNTFVYTAIDKCGNIAICSFKITVQDKENPKITCPANITANGTLDLFGNCSAIVSSEPISVTDNCPMVTVTYVVSGATTASGTEPTLSLAFIQGISTVTFTATDMSGNTTTCSFTVTVLCQGCNCGNFANLYIKPEQNIFKTLNCGDSVAIDCKPTFNPIFGGTFACIGNCSTSSTVNWQVLNGATQIASGTVSGGTFSFSALASLFSTSGVYQVILTGNCDGKPCPPCKIYVKVKCQDCQCGSFTEIYYQPGQGGTKIFKKCGDTLSIACKPTFNPIFGALYNCIGNNCNATISWSLLNPLGSTLASGTVSGGTANFAGTLLSTTGVYQLVLNPSCNGVACPPCKIYIKVNCQNCQCGSFSNLYYRPSQGTPNVTMNCGDSIILSCKSTFNPVFGGNFNCIGNNCNATISWSLLNPTGSTLASGTVSGGTATFAGTLLSTTGVYQLVLNPSCNGVACPPCRIFIKVYCTQCNCGTITNAQVYNISNFPVSIICGNTTPVRIPCRKLGSNFFIHGDFPCIGSDCNVAPNVFSWQLTRPSGSTLSGTTLFSSTSHFDLNLPWSYFVTPGAYSLTILRKCGDKICTCTFNFVVEACPCTCDKLIADVKQGFTVSNSHFSCKRTIKPLALCPSDAVIWKITKIGGATTTLSSTGTNPLIYTFPSIGWYNICMIVSRIDPITGAQCKYEVCKKIFINCGIIDVSPTCDKNVILNGNFADSTSIPGELGTTGFLKDWDLFKNVGGEGIVIVRDTDGIFDRGSVTAIGRKNHYAGIVQKVNLKQNNFVHVTFEYKNWQNGSTPKGTVIDINLQPNANNDLGAQNLQRIVVKDDTSGGWNRVSFTVKGVNFDNKYFVCCVQNGETGEVNSIISLDNFEMCTLETTSAKDKSEERIKFQVFPNPNTGDFNIELPYDASEKMKFRITDLTGRIITEKTPLIGNNIQQISLEDIVNGLYFIQIIQDNQVIGIERFVKQ